MMQFGKHVLLSGYFLCTIFSSFELIAQDSDPVRGPIYDTLDDLDDRLASIQETTKADSRSLKHERDSAKKIKRTLLSLALTADHVDQAANDVENAVNSLSLDCDLCPSIKTLDKKFRKQSRLLASAADTVVSFLPNFPESLENKISESLNQTEELANTADKIESQAETLNETIDSITSVSDQALEVTESAFEKICDVLTRVENLLEADTFSFSETIISILEILQDTTVIAGSSLDKACDIQSTVDGLLNSFEFITSTVDISISNTVSIIDFLETITDTALSSLDKACDIATQIDDLEPEQTSLCETTESILEKLEMIQGCKQIITQADVPFTITQPGTYCVEESLDGNGVTPITIDSDNVFIDLQNHIIINGPININVINGSSNVVIANGFVIGGATSISVGAGTTDLVIDRVNVRQAFIAIGLSNVSCFTISNCIIENNANILGGGVVSITQCTNGLIAKTVLKNNGGNSVLAISDSNNVQCIESIFSDNATGSFIISCLACDACEFKNCFISQNTLIGPGIRAAINVNTCADVIIDHCAITNTDATSVLGSTTSGIVVTSSSRIVIDTCSIIGNITASIMAGINIATSTNGCVLNSLIKNNSSTLAASNGILINASTNLIRENQIANNTGTTSNGINVVAGSNSIISNLSAGHGANNYVGFVSPIATFSTGTATFTSIVPATITYLHNLSVIP